jgi:hypothetical protein
VKQVPEKCLGKKIANFDDRLEIMERGLEDKIGVKVDFCFLFINSSPMTLGV